ncbi:MAG: NAD(P)-dependent oxidoreductase [Acidobacteria bacterium]|nr:NAD(P)-dependent oxidoreductase [Acidobacteriota bacterium]
MKELRVGFIGLGVMGSPMAGHLAKAGYPLAVFDIDRTRAERLAEQHDGIAVVETPRALAERSDIVITMLPSGAYVRDVVLGESGAAEGLRRGDLVLDTSSSEPWITIETAGVLAQKGIAMVDAPVSGAQMGAQAAQLVFMAGGDKEHVSRVMPILNVMGKEVFHLGPIGAGHSMKCINNLITSVTFMATAESLIIGKQFGLDPNVMTDVLNVSTGMSWISQTHFKQRITNRKFDDPFKLELMVKDIGIAMELAKRKKLPVPLSSLDQELWQAAEHFSGKGCSISNMVRWIEHRTGVEIASASAKTAGE